MEGAPGELTVTPAEANRFSSGFCYSSCHAIKTMHLENGITYVAETCQLQVIRHCLVSKADADETSNINMQMTMVPCQHHCFLPLMALVESLFAQLLLPVLHRQKQRGGWPSAVAPA